MTIYEKALINDLKFFKENEVDINMQDSSGKSLLHYAVLGNSFEVIYELLKKGININILDNEGESAFFDCARKAKLEIAKILIVNNANINILNKKKENLFHFAAAKGNKMFLQLLYENNCQVDLKSASNKYPVHYAILNGQIDIVKYLLKVANQSFLILDDELNTLLHYASLTSNDLMIYFLLSEGLNPNLLNNRYETPLFNAVRFGFKDTTNALLSSGAYIDIFNINNESIIDYTNIYEQYNLETLLTNYKMLPKYERLYKNQIITINTLNRNIDELKLLLKTNNVLRNDKFNYTALDYAKLYDFKEIIKLLKKFNRE